MRSVTPQHKPFDQALHDLYDKPAKDAVSRWLSIWDKCQVFPGDTYGVDLVAYRDGSLYAYIEVEQRSFNGRCRYDTIHVAKRKAKFFDKKHFTFLFAIDVDMQWGYFCEYITILASPLREVKNKYVAEKEYFYDVPTSAFVEFEINEVPYWYKEKSHG